MWPAQAWGLGPAPAWIAGLLTPHVGCLVWWEPPAQTPGRGEIGTGNFDLRPIKEIKEDSFDRKHTDRNPPGFTHLESRLRVTREPPGFLDKG